MSQQELKSCPFCGGDDIRIDKHDMHRSPTGCVFSMCCYKCGATFPNRYKRKLLVDLWNTRAQPQHSQPCPYVVTSKGGTSHCRLAERNGEPQRDDSGLVEADLRYASSLADFIINLSDPEEAKTSKQRMSLERKIWEAARALKSTFAKAQAKGAL